MKLNKIAFDSLILKRKARILRAFLFLILAIFSVASPVCADIAPPPPPRPNWLTYTIGVVVAETTAWLIGAEFLWRLIRKTERDKREQTPRSNVYKTMLLAMLISFLIGLVFWKAFGWI